MSDRRERPWKKLRVIVEVTVPPNSRATENDLKYMVSEALPKGFNLPRPMHRDAVDSAIRVKAFKAFWPVFLRKERGISKKKEVPDVYHGL